MVIVVYSSKESRKNLNAHCLKYLQVRCLPRFSFVPGVFQEEDSHAAFLSI